MRLQEGVIEQGGWWALCKDTALGVVFSILCTIRRRMSCGHLDGNTLHKEGTEKNLFYILFVDECPVDIWMGIRYTRRE